MHCFRGLAEDMLIRDMGGNNRAKVADCSNRSCHIEDIV